MTKQLNIDEMLEAAQLAELPGIEGFKTTVEGLATALAKSLAHHLNVRCGEASFDGVALAGTCVAFWAATNGQACPDALAPFDDTEWGPAD